MPEIVSAVLSFAAEKFVEKLTEKVSDDVYKKLRGEPIKKAFQQALGVAVSRYTKGSRLVLAQPLLEPKGILADSDVIEELTHILDYGPKPNIQIIGKKWESAINSGRRIRGFTSFADEAQLFVNNLEDELRSSEIFRPVFEAKDISVAARSSFESAEKLAAIEMQLDGLLTLVDGHFGDLAVAFAKAGNDIRPEIRDFSRYIEEKTRDFTGRQWVFDKVDEFVSSNPRGYYFIIGDPGVGKSSLAAQLVKRSGYVHHFNIRAEGVNNAATFLKNVCAQLIAAYELEGYSILPPGVADDAGFFNKLLNSVSNKMKQDDRCVIVVDGLDEVDLVGMPSGANPLYLPIIVPRGIYVVVTMRDDPGFRPRIECEQRELRIGHDSPHNLMDIADFLHSATSRPGIRAYCSMHKIDAKAFIELMVVKSEGNFMYLRYVLPEIERGTYRDLALDNIPVGLQGYYEDHWRRMRGADEEAWFRYKLPVIIALTAIREPVSIEIIADFSKVKDKRRIRAALQDWQPFLHFEEVEYEGHRQRRYRLYHLSFYEFVAKKQEVMDERVDLAGMHAQIANILGDLFEQELS